MYRVTIITKYNKCIRLDVDDLKDERLQRLLSQKWIISSKIEQIKDMGGKRLSLYRRKSGQ